ncbi:immunoglobulin-like domain-containing protein [Lacrimispora sp. 38-1]|uniref:immunoglobulin-like domain-containing protein n=1 Tax=Lacrimispora sp. 38-1 TaxID=3125778 RepID=UPI003CF2BE6F
MKDQLKIRWKLPVTKIQAVCMAGGVLLYVVMEVVSLWGRQNEFEEYGLKRAGPGQGESIYEVLVKGLDKEQDDKKLLIEIPVRERHYTEEEAEDLFSRLKNELETQMLSENDSLNTIKHNLNFKTRLDSFGLSVRWETSDPDLIDSFGTVYNEDLPDGGKEIMIIATVSDGIHEHGYQFKSKVIPPALTMEEKQKAAFRKWTNEIDAMQQTEDALILPQEFEGQKLKYFKPRDGSYGILPVLGFALAVLLQVRTQVEKQKAGRLREQQLLLDYSEVVSKLVVYIGAGYTVRGAWDRIAAGYGESLKNGKQTIRPAYEEMVKSATQIKSGLSEGRAYSEFGRRCGLQPYIKLAALLEQNQKNGGRQLRNALDIEMASAFEQRKNAARKLGEEAGTRLLLPLLLMLLVVMIMIVVPAFLAFY